MQMEDVSDSILRKVCASEGKTLASVRYMDVINYMTETFDIRFAVFNGSSMGLNQLLLAHGIRHVIVAKEVETDPVFDNLVSGVTIPDENKAAVLINGSMFFPRIVFTILHELAHLYQYFETPNYMRVFALKQNTDPADAYPEELIPYENAANVIASTLFVSNEALIQSINRGLSFNQMMSDFNMSRPALHNRIFDYLVHDLTMNRSMALNFVLQMRNKGKLGTEQIQNVLSMRSLLTN